MTPPKATAKTRKATTPPPKARKLGIEDLEPHVRQEVQRLVGDGERRVKIVSRTEALILNR